MKRFIAILLVIQIVLLSGCTLPFIGEIPPPADEDGGQEMLTAADNSLAGPADSLAGTSGSGISLGAQDGTSGAIALETTAGALDTAVQADVSGGAAEGALTSGSAVAGEMYQGSPDGTAQAVSGQAITEQAITEQAASFEPAGSGYSVTVYYQDGDGVLVPMTRWIQPQQGIARAAIELCIDSAIAREEVAYYGVYPVIPVDTEVLGINVKDGIAVIDFNKHLLDYADAASEKRIITAVVYTLTEFDSISRVRILINGYPQTQLKYGADLSEALGREDVAINSSLAVPLNGQDKVDVFLLKKANEGFTYMVPVSQPVEGDAAGTVTNAQTALLLIQQLIRAQDANGAFSEIPDGVELLNCDYEKGTLTLDFNESLANYGGNDKEDAILKQLAYTVRQMDDIKRIMIKIGGQAAELPEGTDVSSGLAVPATVNDVMDR